MDQTLHALGSIVLTGLPTFLFLHILLSICVKYLYLRPPRQNACRVGPPYGRRTQSCGGEPQERRSNVAEYETALRRGPHELITNRPELSAEAASAVTDQLVARRVSNPTLAALPLKTAIEQERNPPAWSLEAQSDTARQPIAGNPFFRAAAMRNPLRGCRALRGYRANLCGCAPVVAHGEVL